MIIHHNQDNLANLLSAASDPLPWADNGSVPWDDPGFSRRMLLEHLCPEHDRGSRRPSIIAAHTKWIHQNLLQTRPSRILDLGCGPGLYTLALAAAGHTCTGIDFSPASVDYAREQALKSGADCRYIGADIRRIDDYRFGDPPYDLAMFIYGELSMLHPDAAGQVIDRCSRAIRPGGLLLLEVMTHDAVERMGTQPRYWACYRNGVLSDRPYLCLEESFYYTSAETAVIRYWILEEDSRTIRSFCQSCKAWSAESLLRLLSSCRLRKRAVYPRMADIPDDNRSDLETWVLEVESR